MFHCMLLLADAFSPASSDTGAWRAHWVRCTRLMDVSAFVDGGPFGSSVGSVTQNNRTDNQNEHVAIHMIFISEGCNMASMKPDPVWAKNAAARCPGG